MWPSSSASIRVSQGARLRITDHTTLQRAKMGMRARARPGRRAHVHHARGRARNRAGLPGQPCSQSDAHGYVSVCLRSRAHPCGSGRRVLSLSETPPFRCDGGSRVLGEGRTAAPHRARDPRGFFTRPGFSCGWERCHAAGRCSRQTERSATAR